MNFSLSILEHFCVTFLIFAKNPLFFQLNFSSSIASYYTTIPHSTSIVQWNIEKWWEINTHPLNRAKFIKTIHWAGPLAYDDLHGIHLQMHWLASPASVWMIESNHYKVLNLSEINTVYWVTSQINWELSIVLLSKSTANYCQYSWIRSNQHCFHSSEQHGRFFSSSSPNGLALVLVCCEYISPRHCMEFVIFLFFFCIFARFTFNEAQMWPSSHIQQQRVFIEFIY